MEWYWLLAIIFAGLIGLLLTGMPIAFAFVFVSAALFLYLGGEVGLRHMILGIESHMTRFILMPLILFILMGEVMFHTGIAPLLIDALDNWLGKLPGRLGLLAVVSGTLLATLTGASMASCAILGSQLTPEMEKRGYKREMSLGPVLGSAGLAVMIPPSGLAIYIGALGFISIGRILLGIVFPGLIMAALYAGYIVIRSRLQPDLAPAYDVTPPPLTKKVMDTVKYILPVGLIIFLVIGVIILGIATPSEAAATGTAGTFLLALAYRRLNWGTFKKTVRGTLKIAFMILTVLIGAYSFAQILIFSGAARGLVGFILELPVPTIVIFIGIQALGIILGMFLVPIGVITVIVPLFMPVLETLGIDPIWFAVILMINVEMAPTSPPFGNNLIIMKGVAPPGTTMGEIYWAAIPFLICDIICMGFVIVFPQIALYLPSLIQR